MRSLSLISARGVCSAQRSLKQALDVLRVLTCALKPSPNTRTPVFALTDESGKFVTKPIFYESVLQSVEVYAEENKLH